MNTIPKSKLCWNCEANVLMTQEICPYCGVTIQTPSLEGQREEFAPPYLMGAQKTQQIPTSPYASEDAEEKENEEQQELLEDEAVDDFKKFLFAMFLMLAGSVFLIFGVVLAIFSKNGVLTLQWNGDLWYVYLALALPMLLMGLRVLQRVNET